MDGLRPSQTSRQAHHFAASLINGAHEATTFADVAFGTQGLRLGVTRQDDLGALIRGAFRPIHASASRFSLSVIRHDDLPALPQAEWARPWINSGQEVASTVAYPYRLLFDRVVGVIHALDQRDGRAAIWVRHESEVDRRSFITPFRIMLSWLANLIDAEVVHASAAMVNGHAVAFSGASGSGKSTLALALGIAGHPMIADDCLLIEDGRVHAVYTRAKVDSQSQRLLGIAEHRLVTLPDAPRAKKVLPLDGTGVSVTHSAPLAAWGLPVLGSRPGIYPLSRRRAYRMLATDSLREVIGGRARNRLRLARACAAHPAFRVMLTSSMGDNVETVRRLVEGLPLLEEVH
jgi:energy-coupling factor transporter ATP-binding protein EcfA2